MLVGLAVLATFLTISAPARATPSTTATWETGSLLDATEFLEDPTGTLTAADVARRGSAEGFRSLAARGSPNFGYARSTFWFRFTLAAEPGRALHRYLELAHPYVDEVVLHVPREGGFEALRSGRNVSVADRPVHHRDPVFVLDVPAGTSKTYLLQVRSEDTIAAPLRLWTAEAFQRDHLRSLLGLGIYFGIIAAMVVYNLFLAFATRDGSYLAYVAAIVTAHGLFNLVESGVGFEQVWPSSPGWNRTALPLSLALGLGASLVFCILFLDTRRRSPSLHRVLVALAVAAAAFTVFGVFIPYRLRIATEALVAMVASVAVLVAGTGILRGGYRPARYFLLAWSFMMIGTSTVGLKVFGVLPSGFAVDNAFRFGSVLEALLLSFALGDRINALRKEKQEVVAEAARRTDALNAELAGRVLELERTNREVGVLNESLRRQILARTEQLVHSFSASLPPGAAQRAWEPGSVIGGRYRVVGSLGAGGMGAVYEVRRETDDHPFALKVLSGAQEPEDLARFAREAHIIARLRHPNVVSIVDVDFAQTGLPFIVMELVAGRSVRQLRDRYGDVPWALGILAQVAEALRAIHEAGILHRDVKPANVVVASDTGTGVPHVKLVDFGVSSVAGPRAPSSAETLTVDASPSWSSRSGARGRSEAAQASPGPDATAEVGNTSAGSRLTRTGALVGTPRYMAPELSEGTHLATPAVDVFSFGVMAYEMLTGRSPFATDPVLLRVAGAPLPAVARLDMKGISPELVALLAACLAEDPSARPTAGDLVAAATARDVGLAAAERA